MILPKIYMWKKKNTKTTSLLVVHTATTQSCINNMLHNLDIAQAGSGCYMKTKTLQGYTYTPDKAKGPLRDFLNYLSQSQSSEGLALASQ